MPDITTITPDGDPPTRFVAVAMPGLRTPILWAIDEDDTSRPQGLSYLEQIQSVFAGMGPIDMLLAKRLVQYAGKAGVEPSLIHKTVFALTELKGGRSVVVDTHGEAEIEMTALAATDYEGALAEFDRLGFEPAAAPGMN